MRARRRQRNAVWLACVGIAILAFETPVAQAVWTTATNSGNWSTTGNWNPRVPQNGDHAVLPAGKSMTLSTSTAILGSFTNAGTLTFTNWTTVLRATNVVIRNGGKITHAACATNAAVGNTNRVYIICTNLTIDAGGSIDVAGQGYPGGPGLVAWSSGCGPGGGTGGKGASHGGRGYGGPAVYDSTEEPSSAGSGGGDGNVGSKGGNGGGVVRIEAAGRVTVNGLIKADGGSGGFSFGGGGSGGSIYIHCHTFAGTRSGNYGIVSADGNNGGDSGHPGGSGGGGRIALVYDPPSQSNATAATVQFSASSLPSQNNSTVGELGTLSLRDALLVQETLVHSGQLVIPGFASWRPGNFTLNGGWIRFPDGFDLTVGTNLALTGSRAALDLKHGSLHVGRDVSVRTAYKYPMSTWRLASDSVFRVERNLTLSNAYLHVYADEANLNGSELTIGGNGLVTGQGALHLHAGRTNAAVPYGLAMRVGGDLSVAAASWIYPYSHSTNGGSVFLTMRNLTLASTGGFNADSKGYAGAVLQNSYGRGPGAGGYAGQGGVGGGYGGMGYGGVGGGTYGSSNAPTDPGSGGGRGIGDSTGGAGGGLVRIEATRTVTLNGNITADGEDKSGYFNPGGAGGGIYIRCGTFAGSGGTLRAQGGDSSGAAGRCAGGGGGRIAVWRQRDTYVGPITTNAAGGVAATLAYSGKIGTVVFRWIPILLPEVENAAGGASGITLGSASLNGYLTTTGGSPTTVAVYWGSRDGGTPTSGLWNATNSWPTGAWTDGSSISTNVGVSSNRTYYYRYYAENSSGADWATSSTVFVTCEIGISAVSDASEFGPTPGSFVVRRPSTATNEDLVVHYTTGGTATNGVQYWPLTSNVTIRAGRTDATVTVLPFVDPASEADRTVRITVAPGAYVGTPNSAELTISNYTVAARHVTCTTNGLWRNDAVWDARRAPISGDDVVIPAGRSILLDSPTAQLSSFTNAGMLTFTNWATVLHAANVVIRNGGKITHAACATNAAVGNTNRVYITCSNLTIDAGGSIDVAGQGYPGGPGLVAWSSGCGPGGATGGNGGSHGGSGYRGPAVYDSAEEPSVPGSGGGDGNVGSKGGNGGGVARIEAAGRVTVNGLIRADGGSGGFSFGGGGSGGSIYIHCHTFAGTRSGNYGIVSADGNNGGDLGHPGGSGGGGRLALVYDPVAQRSAAPATVQFLASSLPYQNNSTVGEPGTLYLPDAQLLPETLVHSGQLVIPGFTSWNPGNLTLNGGWIRFPDGFDLTVATNLSLTGSRAALDLRYGRLRVGQDFNVRTAYRYPTSAFRFGSGSIFDVQRDLTLSNAYLHVYADEANLNGSELTIGGNGLVTGQGALHLHAGRTNAAVPYGLAMRMEGDLSVGASSWIYPYSHPTNGGSAFLTVRNLTVASTGGFNADSKGYGGAALPSSYGQGPGAGGYVGLGGGQAGVGGGYGGAGYGGVGGGTYGSSNAPTAPGSGGGRGVGVSAGGNGGGLVRIQAARAVTLNGTITADGEDKTGYLNPGGAGGGIYIRCVTFTGSGGTLRAQGGDSAGAADRCSGGGGGRIAVWRQRDTYEGAVNASAAGGVAATPSQSGQPGTVVWGFFDTGTIVQMR